MRLTNKDRKRVREQIKYYVKSPLYPISDKSLERTKRWAFGETMTAIAKSEGVGVSRVSNSVRLLASAVLEDLNRDDDGFLQPHLDPEELAK